MSNLLPPFHKPMDSPMQCHLANDKIAELEADAAELAARKLCGRHCPACVEFTTVFSMPKVEYLGCLRKQSETTKLMDRHAAPLGQPCPFALDTKGEPDCDNCPQPHDEYNEPDCDACDAAWANEGGAK